MAKYKLKVVKQGNSYFIDIDPNKTLEWKLEADTNYQLVDEFGNPIETAQITQEAKNVMLYSPNASQPSVILQNSSEFLPLISEGVATLSNTPVLASEVISGGISLSTLGYIGGGLVVAGGVVAAGGSRKKQAEPSAKASPQNEAERLAEETRQKEAQRLAEEARQQEAQRLAEEARQKEAQRLAEETRQKEAQRLAEETRQKEAQRQAEEARQQEAQRQAEEARQQEAQRLAEETRQKEAQRLAEEARQQEAQRLAEETRQKEAQRLAEEARQKEAQRQAEEARQQEAQRQAEEARQQEAQRQAEEARQQEAQRQAEEARQQEAQRQAEETRQKEAQRQAEEARQKEAQRQAEEARQQEAQRLAEEARQKEAQRQAEEARQQEAQRQAEETRQKEAQRQAEEARQKEAQRQAEEARQKEAQRQAEEARQKEAQRLAEETRQKEAQRLAEEARQKEAQRLAEEARQQEAQRQAEETRQKEAQRQAEEARQKEAQRQAEEARQQEAQRLAEEARQKEAQRQAEETRQKEAEAPIPTLTFKPITGDDIINAEESQQMLSVSGMVKNLQKNDRLFFKIGDVSYPVTVEGESFKANVRGETLANHKTIAVDVIRGDKTLNAIQDHAVTVKTTAPIKPTVKLNNVTEDNIINLAESQKEAITVSGTVENAKNGDEVLVSCGCPTCSGIQWVTVKTDVQNGNFSVNFRGETLVKEGYSVVKARVITKDVYGNTAQGDDEKNYEVDITPPTPSLTFEPIGTINQNSPNMITLSGQVIHLLEGESGTVTAVVGNQKYTTTFENGRYRIEVPKTQFANGNKVALQLNVKDKAQNSAELNVSDNEQNQHYVYDVTLNKPQIHINAIPVVNQKTQAVILSGTLSYDSDVNVNRVNVQVSYNRQTLKAVVEGNQWRVILPAEQIAQQGENSFTVTASVEDGAGNQAQTETQSQFNVDTQAPAITLKLNAIEPIGPQNKVLVSGIVNGELKGSEQVGLIVNGQKQLVDIQNGKFSTEIDRLKLEQNASQKIIATLQSEDDAGNIGTAQDEQGYTFIASQEGELSLILNRITGDDHLNVSEAKTATTTISGSVRGAGIQAGQTVALTIGKETIDVALDNALRFNYNVETKKLVENGAYQIQASINGKSVNRVYSVANEATNQIQITEIADQFDLNPISKVVRLSGQLHLDGLAAKYGNAHLVETIQVELNNKTYTLGLGKITEKESWGRDSLGWRVKIIEKHRAFTLDIPEEDLIQAQGETMRFSIPDQSALIYDTKRGRYDSDPYEISSSFLSINDQNKYVLDRNEWLQEGTSKTIVNQAPQKMVEVRGIVSGNAKLGDVVEIQIGDQTYRGNVEENRLFSISVPHKALDGNGISSIKATLKGRDYASKEIDVSTESQYHGNHTVTNSKFDPSLSYNEVTDDKVAYFIRALRTYNFNATGHLVKQQIGLENYELTYKFIKESQDGSGYRWVFDEVGRETVRTALKLISDYTRIKFVQLDDDDPTIPDISYSMLSGAGRSHAWFGGPVNFYGGQYGWGNLAKGNGPFNTLHETLHSLGAKHPHEEGNILGDEDSFFTSVMSYNGHSAMSYLGQSSGTMASHLRIFDLIYLHFRYGVNPEQRSGNDVYTFKNVTSFVTDNNVYIWDGAGVDTFDASMEKESVYIDLTPGSWIHRGKKTDKFLADTVQFNYKKDLNAFFGSFGRTYEDSTVADVLHYNEGQAFIGYGTQIERVIGSSLNDELKGNKADNDIFGGSGDDKLWGRAGNDYLDGGKGADTMYGGAGHDTFVVDDSRDVVEEADNEGNDTVLAYIDYKLTANVENLTLQGTALKAEGNDLANRIIGNILSNELTGGEGADTFVFNSPLNGNVDKITDFNPQIDRIELSREIFKNITTENLKDYIKYDAQSGYISYDPDGKDIADAIIFAQLQTNLTLEPTHFILA